MLFSNSASEHLAVTHRAGAREMVFRAGGLAILRAMNRTAVRIIAYHRFPASCAHTLRAQCAYICSYHRVVSLADVDRWLYEGAPLPPRSIAVTVDDGYRDFFEVAYPIFRDHGIPVTIFLTTGFLDRSCWLWGDLVRHLFHQSSLAHVEIPCGADKLRFGLRSEEERVSAVCSFKEAAKRIDDDVRAKLVHEILPRVLDTNIPDVLPVECEPLRWDQVREMYRNGIRFGAHTSTHPILSSVRSEERLSAEIAGSKQRLEEELGHPIFHFAYPNGTAEDVNSDVIRHVRNAGFKTAFMAEPGPNRRSADRYTLRRNAIEPVTPMPFFGRNILRSR